jgi:hypothetical protein
MTGSLLPKWTGPGITFRFFSSFFAFRSLFSLSELRQKRIE